MEEKKAIPGIAQVCILFSVVIFFFLMIGYRVQKREFYSGILITEIILIMLPALIYLLSFGYDLKKVLRLNKTSFLNFVTIFGIMIFAIPFAALINLINLFVVNSIFGKIIIEQPPTPQNLTGLLLNILVIGGSAGLCEEFLFRGVIQRGLERFGTAKAIMLAAFLFGLTHLDFQKLLGTFALGVLIGFIVYRTNSLYCGMFAHFTNNSTVVIIGYISYIVQKFLGNFKDSGVSIQKSQINLNEMFSVFKGMPGEQIIIIAFIYVVFFLLLFSIFMLLLYAFIKLNPVKTERMESSRIPGSRKPLLWLLPGVSFILVMYFVEAMVFKGASNMFIHQLKMILGA